MGIGDVRRTGENRTWTAHPAEQTDPSPHRDQRESRRDGESASNGEFVNTLLDSSDPAMGGAEEGESERAKAIEMFLKAPFSQVEPFATYLSSNAHFDTHQGVKGLEFDRVMVIMDDEEARGFLFKYEDLFGGKSSGEKTVEATRRLFYVTCSRAKQSLALIAHTRTPERVRKFVVQEGWFSGDEIITDI